jgi:transposase
MAMTIVESTRGVIGGVDTHLDVHVAAAVDAVGGVLGVESFPTTEQGYRRLIEWLGALGPVMLVGVEGTGSYGAGLTRSLQQAGLEVVEVDRPNRQARHRAGKSDPLDAIAAARAALSGTANGAPKSRTGNVEAIRVLMVARRSAVEERITTLNQLRHLCITAPEPIRRRFSGLTPAALAKQAAALKPRRSDPLRYSTLLAIRTLGRRVLYLRDETKALNAVLRPLIQTTAPGLLGVFGVGYDTAAKLLIAAGDNPQRLRSEAAWAHLCGVAPLPASSGKTVRHRLNRGGDRQANSALYHVMITRLSHHEPTKAYVARRLADGKTLGETGRMLKRYIAREVYKQLPRPA